MGAIELIVKTTTMWVLPSLLTVFHPYLFEKVQMVVCGIILCEYYES